MRNSSINLLYILVATLMAGALQSCDDDYFNGGDATKVTITATTAFSNTTSRAVFEEDTYFESGDIVITNYCFLLFDDEKKLIESFDIAPTAFPYIVELPQPVVGKTYHAFLLGNVTTETLSAVTTIDELQNSTFEINRMYNTPTDKKLFTWSDYLTVTQARKNLDFILNPNVAKITATIKNESSESVIKSVRVKNVVNKVGYAQNALNEYSPDYVKNVSSEPTLIKYDIETFDTPLKKGDEPKKISWYVPQNIQGDGTRIPGGNKANETYLHGGIPDNATYLEIDGVRTADNVTASYRVYPGIKKDKKEGEEETYAEMTNFDVKADVIYNLDITINNDGIDNESTNITTGYKPNSGTTATAKIKLPENSNCYMIHPIGDRIADVTVYELPISRVNQYWATVAGEPGTEADDHALTADSKWHVEVIWQDINTHAIKFCDEYGVDLPDVAPGEGLNPFCFKLVNNSNTPGSQTYGNVLVGLKKLKSDGTPLDGYCWSWHLWITDYNPDAAPTWSESSNKLYATNANSGRKIDLQGVKYGESVEFTSTSLINAASYSEKESYDGNVQHYNSEFAPYWTNSGRTASSSLWDGTGIYANKWIMDRNIGALSSNNSDIENPLDGWGMYYQYGRKDPFSYKKTYDIEGNARKGYTEYGKQWEIITGKQTDMNGGIMNPNTYYAYAGPWLSNVTSKAWFSPDKDPMTPTERGDKTLFDPCPPGWRIPLSDAFTFGTYSYSEAYSTISKYINNVTTNNLAHSNVCVYFNVKGKYRDPNDNYNNDGEWTDNGEIDYRNKENHFNKDLTGYGNRWRNFAVLYSTDIFEGSVASVKAHFPIQGHIDGETGSVVKIFHDHNISPVQNEAYPQGYWRDYVCCTYVNKDNYYTGTSGLQVRMWTLEQGTNTADGDPNAGTCINFLGSTMNYYVNARQEQRNGLLYLRFHGTVRTNNRWDASGGFNVRCIQE